MDFIDLATQQKRIYEKLNGNIRKVLGHGQYIMGPEIRELETQLAAYAGVEHALSCASGTDALRMALMALQVGPGDAVFTTPFTFAATAEVIVLLGATPVFVDIEPETFNIDPLKLEQAILAVKSGDAAIYPLPRGKSAIISRRRSLVPRCIISVDLFGLPADYDAIQAVAGKYGLAVLEDAAQSFGAEYKGRKAGSLGRIGCTSFFPAKPFGGYGDGGMCFTDDDALGEALRSIRRHGQGNNQDEHIRIGINSRLDTLQAAILLAKFEIFPEEVELRQEVAANYAQLLAGDSKLKTPAISAGYKSIWAQYSVLAEDQASRTALREALKRNGIPTAIYYPKPLHRQRAFAGLGYQAADFPIAEDCASRIFSLPMHPYLQIQDQERIVAILREH